MAGEDGLLILNYAPERLDKALAVDQANASR
jgi:hypothetical protein